MAAAEGENMGDTPCPKPALSFVPNRAASRYQPEATMCKRGQQTPHTPPPPFRHTIRDALVVSALLDEFHVALAADAALRRESGSTSRVSRRQLKQYQPATQTPPRPRLQQD